MSHPRGLFRSAAGILLGVVGWTALAGFATDSWATAGWVVATLFMILVAVFTSLDDPP